MMKTAFAVIDVKWLVTERPLARYATTAFNPEQGTKELFSVFVVFAEPEKRRAKVYVVVPEMESRLPAVGGSLIITAGHKLVAECTVTEIGREDIPPRQDLPTVASS